MAGTDKGAEEAKASAMLVTLSVTLLSACASKNIENLNIC